MAFSTTNDFTAGTNAVASEVNQNFTDIETELNAFPTDGTLSDGAVSTTAKLANSIITTAKFASTAFYDTDAMTQDSATACASQQSIKAYVDTSVAAVTPLAKAWANADGRTDNAACTINKSSGVTSITRTGTGLYTIAWSTNFDSANYCLVIAGATKHGATVVQLVGYEITPATGTCTIGFRDDSTGLQDPVTINILAYGDQ